MNPRPTEVADSPSKFGSMNGLRNGLCRNEFTFQVMFETTLPIYVEKNLPNCLIIRRLRANQGPNRYGRLFLNHPETYRVMARNKMSGAPTPLENPSRPPAELA